MSKEIQVGKVFYSYAEERKATKDDVTPRPHKFNPEFRDTERLLPRLREATRR